MLLLVFLLLPGCPDPATPPSLGDSNPFAPPAKPAMPRSTEPAQPDCAQPQHSPASLAEAATWVHPLGPPSGAGYYDAQPFGQNDHLGNDWNGNGGKNTDLGDPVHAMAAGVVTESFDAGGGWGNLVRVAHRTSDGRTVESLYAHLHQRFVCAGDVVTSKQPLGTIGTAHGRYLAHLHLELRDAVGLPLGGGYGEPSGHLDPTTFLQDRGVAVDPVWRPTP